MNLATPLTAVPRLGTKAAQALRTLGLTTVKDLLWHVPSRYEDFRQVTPIKNITPNVPLTVKARIDLIANKRGFRSRLLVTEALVSDETGALRVVWFNQPFISKTLAPGDVVYLAGTVKNERYGLQLASPLYEKEHPDAAPTHAGRLVALYPLTAGITHKQLRSWIATILHKLPPIPDWLPEEFRSAYNLISLDRAVRSIHIPSSPEDIQAATTRFKFDELALVQLRITRARRVQLSTPATAFEFHQAAVQDFVKALPFALTPGQKKAAWDIIQDTTRPVPMNRLLSGDVGSGKTVVAALGIFNIFKNQAQAALMVPTEILAAQHFTSLAKLLGPYGVRVGLYTRTQRRLNELGDEEHTPTAGEIPKKAFLKFLQEGRVDLVIGTQALLTEQVDFKNLGLVIVDEQHRFGVEQRRIIREKGRHAHFLSMTATPIPRSLALVVYGDLDISAIRELPPGRKPIITRLVTEFDRSRAYDFVRQEIAKGRQAFVLCPLIAESDVKEADEEEEIPATRPSTDDRAAVMSEYEKLQHSVFPDLKVAFVHGKMKAADKEATMQAFAAGVAHILIATSVIEVGVNIPNASIMLIEGAEHFGLAQLHQFRGRVGRSDHQSYCFLFSNAQSAATTERLTFFAGCTDGFKLAEKDLELRGPGAVYGTEQSGMDELHLAKLTDIPLIEIARDFAQKVVPKLERYPTVLAHLEEWKKTVHWE